MPIIKTVQIRIEDRARTYAILQTFMEEPQYDGLVRFRAGEIIDEVFRPERIKKTIYTVPPGFLLVQLIGLVGWNIRGGGKLNKAFRAQLKTSGIKFTDARLKYL